MCGISRKLYLEISSPTEEDTRSAQERILDGVKKKLDEPVEMNLSVYRKLYPLCYEANWKITVSLVWDGWKWVIVQIEEGNRENSHYGIAIDLGSTTVVGRIIDCCTGKCMTQVSVFNRQIRFGKDILSRIFYSKDIPEHLEEIRVCTVESILEVCRELERKTNIAISQCLQMVIAGNTTMIHFLLGMDAFCVFSTPYAVRADAPGFIRGKELEIPVIGYVYIYPCKSNYLGGDIISGMVATKIYRQDGISAFFDIGTNGELVIGCREFLLCGAGAAGPALEGGVVRSGMRADTGAVDHVKIVGSHFENHVIGEEKAKGICGSGIVDLIAEMFLEGWIDFRGEFLPEKSSLIKNVLVRVGHDTETEEEAEKVWMPAVEYEPGLYFFQDDIEEFIRTKSAAYTMVEYMLMQAGISPNELERFYVAGAFGRYVSKTSAITIGMYPDMDHERIANVGNSSLEGAQLLLLHKEYLKDIDNILEKMTYIQYGAVEGFLDMMNAARVLPHMDIERYPSVKMELAKRGQLK